MTFKMTPPSFHNEDQQPEIIQKDLDKDIIAEANKDGTIYLDKDIDLNSEEAKDAIAHEKEHLKQFESGELDYTDDYVIWKGKKYPRKNMNEGSKHLPWEKEAYDKTKNA